MSDRTREQPGDDGTMRAPRPPTIGAPTVKNAALTVWPDLGFLTAFWIYVALANVLWASSMQMSLANTGMTHVFAPWNARLVQHLILYPALIGGLWVSRRMGWQPL